jgi:hypothetical protein
VQHALLCGASADVRVGNHDDPLTDVEQFVQAGFEEMVFLPFFDNLLPAFEQQLELLTPEAVAAKAEFKAAVEKAAEKEAAAAVAKSEVDALESAAS